MSSPTTTTPTPPKQDVARPQRSLASRVLMRPEIGALAAAIAIFIFFFATAPAFRTLPSLSLIHI